MRRVNSWNLSSQRRLSDQYPSAYNIGFRHNSLTRDKENFFGKPVSWCKLYRYAKLWEVILIIIGIILACINGLFIPIGVIIYGEFTALLIDRTVMIGTSTPTLTISIFGGGRILTNASRAENQKALIEDSQAFGIGCTVFSMMQFIVAAISVDLFNYTALKSTHRIKMKFLEAVLRQDTSWYDLNTTMNFATKVSDDVEKLREGIGEKVPMLVYLVMSFVTAVIISLIYGWELTLVVLSCAPVIIATTALVARVQSSLTTQELGAYSKAGVIAEEVLSSIRTVVAFGGEEKEIERYSHHLKPAKKMGIKKGVYSGIGSGIMWLIIYATYALAFWYGVGLILDSRHEAQPVYTPAVLMIIFFSCLQGAQNVGLTAPHVEAVNCARASGSAIYEVIERKPVIDSLSNEGTTPPLDGDIELIDVYFGYPARSGVQVLSGLNLKIRQNETVALVGSSGCGKSTVLQLIQRMYDPDAGSVRASGYDLRELNVRHLRRHIAVVGQEPVLFAGTIRENIRMSNPACTDEELYLAARHAHCHGFIRNLPKGYDTMIGERGAQLSGGQKQRIALARALVRHPKILLLDEATSALDPASEAKVQRALDAAAHGRTTVMVSHRLATVVNATRIVVIDQGIIEEEGTHEELMDLRGKYYHLVLTDEPAVTPGTETHKRARLKEPELEKALSLESVGSDHSGSSVQIEEEKVPAPVQPTTWQILRLCKPEKYLMLVGVLAAIMVGFSFPMVAVLFGETYGLLQSFDEDFVRRETNFIAYLFLLVGLIAGVGIFCQIFIFNLTGVRLTKRLRVATFKHILGMEIGWFDDPSSGVGALCGRLAADAAAVQGATGTRIGALMQATATIVIGLSLSLYYTWKMTLVSMVAVPLVIISVVLEGRVLEAGNSSVRVSFEKATTIATEAISNIRTVAAFCGEKQVLHRYYLQSEAGRVIALKACRWRGCVFACGQTMPIAGYALSLWYGGELVARGELEYKSVIKVSEALIFGAWMMGQALAFAPNFGAAISAAGRVLTLLARNSTVKSSKTPAVSEGYIVSGKIEYSNIKFRYPTRREAHVVQGLSLVVESGHRVALVGPSGCGKSTLIQLLQRLYDPDSGAVYLDDYNIATEMRISTLRRNLGIVSQEPVLFDRTIAENIAYGDNTRVVPIEEIVTAAKKANVHLFIAALPTGYDTRIGARASQLSGGQKQRIAIARALVRNPRVLLLDEATSALDTHSEKVVQEALDRASEGRTCLIIAHRLATIQNADAICVIDKGVVAERGTHKELIQLKGLYKKLYELQCGILEETEPADATDAAATDAAATDAAATDAAATDAATTDAPDDNATGSNQNNT